MSLYIVRDANGKEICAVMPDEAPLIAAAPDLLKALSAAQSALRSFQHGNRSEDFARGMADNCDKVISRAIGATA